MWSLVHFGRFLRTLSYADHGQTLLQRSGSDKARQGAPFRRQAIPLFVHSVFYSYLDGTACWRGWAKRLVALDNINQLLVLTIEYSREWEPEIF